MCAELVKAEAVICRFCGHKFDISPPSVAVNATAAADGAPLDPLHPMRPRRTNRHPVMPRLRGTDAVRPGA